MHYQAWWARLAALVLMLSLAACGAGPAGEAASVQQAAPRSATPQALTPSQLMDWAEARYPTIFPAASRVEGYFAPYTYRRYGNNYLGVSTGSNDVAVYLYGDISGWQIRRMGALASFACTVSPDSCNATAAQNCQFVVQSMEGYAAVNDAGVSCDGTYAYISTWGIQSAHPMMNGITQTILQVPVAQNFTEGNAWRIPLAPALAATTTSAVDGPIGIAVNGVPLFNPCKQGGCEFGDTKLLGELDICNGHAGRADDYHYHAAPVCMMADQPANHWDTHPIGWALDGFAIFGYNNPDGTVATRDTVCGGNTVAHPNAPAGYAYHVTDASPYILSCFRGTPSPDLAGQGGKFAPLRVPSGPGGGPGVSNMVLAATAESLAMGGTSRLTWQQSGTSYEILYTRTSSVCWNFVFKTNGTQTGSETDCRAF